MNHYDFGYTHRRDNHPTEYDDDDDDDDDDARFRV
jgi:hypothetical protein